MASVVILMEVVVSMVTALQGREGGQEEDGRSGSLGDPGERRTGKVKNRSTIGFRLALSLGSTGRVWALAVVSGL